MDERQLALIQRLSDGGSHSGEAIAREFGLTRAAVWKTLRKTAGQGGAIDQPWASLDSVLGETGVGRNVLVARLLDALLEALDRYAGEGLAPFLARWRAHDAYWGEPVRVLIGERVIEGRHAGVAEDGSLLLDTADGRRAFQSGEVSLRPLAVPA